MTRALQSFGLFLLICGFSTAGIPTAQPSPLQNITLTWVHGIFADICWSTLSEESVQNCKYKIDIKTRKSPVISTRNVTISPKPYCTDENTIMNGGYIQFVVHTFCNNKMNEPAVITHSDPDLVTSWQCVIISSKLTRCSWQPAPGAPPDLRFFYVLACENCNSPVITPLQECPSYTYTGKMRSGCNFTMKTEESLHALFNGTMVHKPVMNTYQSPSLNVKPPPLDWTVTETAKSFDINWTPPDVLLPSAWTFVINYTRCGEPMPPIHLNKVTNHNLDREPSCQYRIKIKAKSLRGDTEWSQEKTCDADFNLSLSAAIIIPLVLAVMVVLTLVCCRKNKENIFPKVPVPRDLLSDISENNNKITVGRLYSPAEEEEDCKVTLVIDPLINVVDT